MQSGQASKPWKCSRYRPKASNATQRKNIDMKNIFGLYIGANIG